MKVAVEFLTSTLSVVPGFTRHVHFSNHVFRRIPIYQRGDEVSIQYMKVSTERKDAVSSDEALKSHTFEALTKLLTKGRYKSGLFTLSVYQKITKLVAIEGIGFLQGYFVPSESASTGTADEKPALVANGMVADDCKYLGRCVEEVPRFLVYSYSEQVAL
jgi:hypothetical protein